MGHSALNQRRSHTSSVLTTTLIPPWPASSSPASSWPSLPWPLTPSCGEVPTADSVTPPPPCRTTAPTSPASALASGTACPCTAALATATPCTEATAASATATATATTEPLEAT